MRARGANQSHRVATPLELLFDLCFVVAVAQAASSLHHALDAGHVGQALLSYPMVFFAVWWAWMNFTWFASAYDTDDVAYRLAVLVQIAGVLILAAGVPRSFDDRDLAIVTLGYAVMRVSLAAQWLRAAHSDPPARRTDLRYAFGVSVCMLGWLVVLVLPGGWQLAAFLVMVVAELSVPVLAERHGSTTWHPHHIAERYGLFTLIVLGESVLAATLAVQSALDAGQAIDSLLVIGGGGLLIVFSMWWVYFSVPTEEPVTETGLDSFRWGLRPLLRVRVGGGGGRRAGGRGRPRRGDGRRTVAPGRDGDGGGPGGDLPCRHRLRARPAQPARHRAALLVTSVAMLALVAIDLGVLAVGVVLAALVAVIMLTVPDEDRVPMEDVQ